METYTTQAARKAFQRDLEARRTLLAFDSRATLWAAAFRRLSIWFSLVMSRYVLAFLVGLLTNLLGYVLGMWVLSFNAVGSVPDAQIFPWRFAIAVWLVSLFIGGRLAAVVLKMRNFLLGYLSAAAGSLVIAILMLALFSVNTMTVSALAGVLITSVLGGLGGITYKIGRR